MCSAMDWNHLPVAGGIACQNPDLMEAFRIIFSVKSQYEAQQKKKQEAEAKKNKATGRRPRRR